MQIRSLKSSGRAWRAADAVKHSTDGLKRLTDEVKHLTDEAKQLTERLKHPADEVTDKRKRSNVRRAFIHKYKRLISPVRG